MERYKIILILILISLNMVSVVYSQNDSTLTIRTKPGFSIDYIAGFKNAYPDYAEIIDIKKLSFITDSTVKVTISPVSAFTAKDSYKEININKINEIRFKGDNKMGQGAGIGAGLGFLIGAILGVGVANDESPSIGETIGAATTFGIFSALPGAILGGIIGVLISDKDSLMLSTVKDDKKDKLMKFLKRNNKTEHR